jgi:hypothetical protein
VRPAPFSPGHGDVRIYRPGLASATLVAFVVAAVPAAPVVAHGGEGPSLEVVPNRVEPGETVTVLGEELAPLTPIHVDLLTAAGNQRVIETEVDEEGHFIQSLTVPAELAPRVYELRGTDGAGIEVSTFLTVLASEEPSADTGPPAPMAVMGLALAGVLAGAALILLIVRRIPARGRGPAR